MTTYAFTDVTANHIISATFAINTYQITASAGANGSVTPAGATTVASGANQTYTITPATGYKVADVLVNGKSAGALATYTFTNVTANHIVSATFAAVDTTPPGTTPPGTTPPATTPLPVTKTRVALPPPSPPRR